MKELLAQLYFKLRLLLKKHSTAVKSAEIKAQKISSEEELNSKIIEPAVRIAFRLLAIQKIIKENEQLYVQEDQKKKSLSGFSTAASKSIENLSIITRNLTLLRAEEAYLITLNHDFIESYKTFLKQEKPKIK